MSKIEPSTENARFETACAILGEKLLARLTARNTTRIRETRVKLGEDGKTVTCALEMVDGETISCPFVLGEQTTEAAFDPSPFLSGLKPRLAWLAPPDVPFGS